MRVRLLVLAAVSCTILSLSVVSASAEQCLSYRSAQHPWQLEWEGAGAFDLVLGTVPMTHCAVLDEDLLTGRFGLQCRGADEQTYGSWLAYFPSPDGVPRGVLLWADEVYYPAC